MASSTVCCFMLRTQGFARCLIREYIYLFSFIREHGRSLAVAGSSASDGLLMVFYYSMASSSFPDPWKLAKVHAIHKKGSQADVSN